MIGRIIVLVVVSALVAVVCQQRTHIKNDIDSHKCDLSASFFGFHVDAPSSVKQAGKTQT